MSELSDAVVVAVEERLRAHDVRLRPNVTIESVIADMQSKGVSLDVKFGALTGKVGNGDSAVVADVPSIIETWAAQNESKLFPRSMDNVSSRDQLDRSAKIKFIAEKGIAAFEALPATAPAQPTELSASRMTAEQWRSLPRSVKAELCSKWTPAQIAAIQTRKR